MNKNSGRKSLKIWQAMRPNLHLQYHSEKGIQIKYLPCSGDYNEMLMVDTIKLKLPVDGLFDINFNHFSKNYHTETENDNEVTKQIDHSLKKEFLPFGVKKLAFKEHRYYPEIIVETSAKILKEDYHESIHKNNILKVLSNLNTPSISLKEDVFLNCQILRMDVTDNLKVARQPQEYLDALYNYRVNPKYYVKPYKTGISFSKDVRTKHLKDRISFYTKFDELLKDKEMLRYVNPIIFKDEIRVESNLNHFCQIRRCLNLTSNSQIKLCDVLESDKKVNLEMLNNITGDYQFKLVDEPQYKNLTLSQLEKTVGREQIIIQLEYDVQSIRKFIRSKLGQNTKPTRYYKEYEELLVKMIALNQKPHKNCDSLINELKFKLAA